MLAAGVGAFLASRAAGRVAAEQGRLEVLPQPEEVFRDLGHVTNRLLTKTDELSAAVGLKVQLLQDIGEGSLSREEALSRLRTIDALHTKLLEDLEAVNEAYEAAVSSAASSVSVYTGGCYGIPYNPSVHRDLVGDSFKTVDGVPCPYGVRRILLSINGENAYAVAVSQGDSVEFSSELKKLVSLWLISEDDLGAPTGFVMPFASNVHVTSLLLNAGVPVSKTFAHNGWVVVTYPEALMTCDMSDLERLNLDAAGGRT